MRQAIIDAFHEIRAKESPDMVIANPELNRLFLNACREKGIDDAAEAINRALLNARKAGYLVR